MAVEIERKFLVRPDAWTPRDAGVQFTQGYLSASAQCVVRIRIEGDRARLTVKGKTIGITRSEFEYPVPVDDATTMLETLCEQPVIDKHRYREQHGAHVWEIDVFHGDNEGLIVAEVELVSEDDAPVMPPWVGVEVTADRRYSNFSLSKYPFRLWKPTTPQAVP